jgi:hypothetical protein
MSAPSALHRRIRAFVGVQACLSTLVGFGPVLVYAENGLIATVHYTFLMLTATMAGTVLAYASSALWRVDARRMAYAALVVPLLGLGFAQGRPTLLALAVGGFLGLSWGARHWLELGLLADAERDDHAAHCTVIGVVTGLLSIGAASAWLTWAGDGAQATQRLYLGFAGVAALGLVAVVPRLPAGASLQLQAPLALLRQPAYRACLPLYALESGLFGVGLVLGASGAISALGSASHYGWVATLATLVGAFALHRLRHRRHQANRDRAMALACAGIAVAQALLGLSAWLPALYVLHLMLQAGVAPFWMASEQVLNQRTLDIHGALADRIVVRESTLWLFRVTLLALFWGVMHDATPAALLQVGASLMVAATVLEYLIGRAWLSHHGAVVQPAA